MCDNVLQSFSLISNEALRFVRQCPAMLLFFQRASLQLWTAGLEKAAVGLLGREHFDTIRMFSQDGGVGEIYCSALFFIIGLGGIHVRSTSVFKLAVMRHL